MTGHRVAMDSKMQKQMRKKNNGHQYHTSQRFPDRKGEQWIGPLVDYKELELLRKFLTPSSKLMSRRRAGTNAQEQKALKEAIKRARFLALIPYSGT